MGQNILRQFQSPPEAHHVSRRPSAEKKTAPVESRRTGPQAPAPGFTQNFSRVPVHSQSGGSALGAEHSEWPLQWFAGVQASLEVSATDDPQELEADSVADRIVHLAGKPDTEATTKPTVSGGGRDPHAGRIALQSSFVGIGRKQENGVADRAAASVVRSRGSGQPLPGPIRRRMETAFGADFSGIRIHTDAAAQAMSRQLAAHACTHGNDVYFNTGKFAPGTTSGRHRLAHELTHTLQQRGGGGLASAPLSIYRQGKTREKLNIDLGWLDLSGTGLQTNGQLAAVAGLTMHSLQDELKDVESDSLKAQADDWLQTVKGSLPFFDRHSSEPIADDLVPLVPLVNHEVDELVAIRNGMQAEKDARLRDALRREQRAVDAAAEEAEALQPKLDDAFREAFRKGSAGSVKDVVGTVKGALSIGRNLRSLSESITTDIHFLDLPLYRGTHMTVDKWSSQIGRVKVTITNVSKYTDMLAKLGRGLALINIALTAADRSKRATDAEQGMKDLNDVVSVSTDLASLSSLSMPPHMSLMTTLWIKPALKVISKQIGQLVNQLSNVNRTSVAVTGDLLMYPEVEPGGQEMFNLMVAVLHAGDPSAVPQISGRSAKYLYDHRDKLEAGAEEAVPTEGWWFMNELDSPRARTWLFSHRKRVWAMFYGSMEIPARIPGSSRFMVNTGPLR